MLEGIKRLLLVQLCLFSVTLFGATTPLHTECISLLDHPGITKTEPAAYVDYDVTLGTWAGHLSEYYTRPIEGNFFPASFPVFKTLDRMRNKVFFWMIKNRLRTFLRPEGELGDVSNRNSYKTAIATVAEQLENLEESPLRSTFSGSLFDFFRTSITPNQKLEDGLNEWIGAVESAHISYMQDIHRYQEKYGAEFFSESAITRGAMNVVAMRLFAKMSGTEVPDADAMNAIALLHPITDDVIDSGKFSKTTMVKITRLLKGEPQTPDSPYETLVFDFINHIFRAFPPQEHPLLAWSLDRLHAEQLKSFYQRTGVAFDDMLQMTLVKGGLSTVAAGYIALGGLNEKQFEFFYKGGAIFQFMDDFSDVRDDLHDHVETIWTRQITQKKTLSEPMAAFLQTEGIFESELDRLAEGFQGGDILKVIYPVGFKLTLLRAALNYPPRFLKDINPMFKSRLPISTKQVRSIHGMLVEAIGSLHLDESHPMYRLSNWLTERKTIEEKP